MAHVHPGVKFLATLFSKPRPEIQEYVAAHFSQLNRRQAQWLSQNHTADSPFSVAVAQSEVGKRKNRYCDIIPYDRNRIKLTRADLGGVGRLAAHDDYINASTITAPWGIPRRYIATQGPIPTTVSDFWQMVVEQGVEVVVCLTPEIERGHHKCARYWPVGSQPLSVRSGDNVTVLIQNVEPEQMDTKADCIVRRIQVDFVQTSAPQTTLATATVTQLQYLGWADHGVPDTTSSVLALIQLANRLQSPEAGPMVVHCSAGCGRTGTFCVIDSALAWMEMKTGNTALGDPVFQLTDVFRQQRTTMVQAASQYMFCYEALWDACRLAQRPE